MALFPGFWIINAALETPVGGMPARPSGTASNLF